MNALLLLHDAPTPHVHAGGAVLDLLAYAALAVVVAAGATWLARRRLARTRPNS
jgi:hypothetical protein